MQYQKNILHSILAISFVALFSAQVEAAAGDCLSWLWGGNNEATTYSPPYPTNYSPTNQEEQRRSTVPENPYILGQTSGSAPTVHVSPLPPCTVVGPQYYVQKPESPASAEAIVQSPQNTALKPVITKEWSYSRIESIKYKPVELIDPSTGATSTAYREEKSKTLLPWLHQKETIEYKPIVGNGGLGIGDRGLRTNLSPSPSSVPRYEPMNYTEFGNSSTIYKPQQTPIPAPCVVGGQQVIPQMIPYTPSEGAAFDRNPDASTRASAYFSQGGGSRYSNISNFGIPPVREGFERNRSSSFVSDPGTLTNVPPSAADAVPVVDPNRSEYLQKPEQAPDTVSISIDDIKPLNPYNEAEDERPEAGDSAAAPLTSIKSSEDVNFVNSVELPTKTLQPPASSLRPSPTVVQANLIRTPVPDLPTVKKPESDSEQSNFEDNEEQPSRYEPKKKKRTVPTQMFK